jgi:hypothetical protein
MLSSPWSISFVLAAIAGAMLVPGCRPQDGPSFARFSSSQIVVEVADRPETRPAAPYPTESADRRRP